ncbi:aminoglycoside adenylyltransferase domain-containing protein, partial [Chloroflexota bacterium]
PQPTPYQDVNVVLNLVLSNMQAILEDHFIGLYLGGSLALGDFNPHRSDIDFVAVTVDELPPETIVALEEMHTRLWATGTKWAMKLDGSYVPQQVLRRWTSDDTPCPFVEEDRFYVTNQGSAVIQRHIIRQYEVVVAGPSPHTLIDPVDADDLRSALRDMLEKWWRPLLDDPAWVQQSQKQPFAILTMCRALYTLEHGVVASKPVAARWGQQAIGEQWTALIEWALAWPHDTKSNHLASTLSLIQYTLKRYKHHNERV